MQALMQPEMQLLIGELRRFIRREIWLREKRIDPSADRLPDDVFTELLGRATEFGLGSLMAPSGNSVGPEIDLADSERLRIAEELSQHRAGVLNPSYGLFDPDPPPQLYAATAEQQATWLAPLINREARCFRGLDDPDLAELPTDRVRIRARKHRSGWMLDGTKLFVSGASDADYGIVYANSELSAGHREGVSAIVVETDRVGFQRWRSWPTIAFGRDTMELNLSAVKTPPSHLLGEVGNGPALANDLVLRRRLFTAAHLTGVASAAQDMSRGAVWGRRAFGAPIATAEGTRLTLADNEIALQASRALYLSAAEQMAALTHAARVFATDAAIGVVDRAIGLHGIAGGSVDLPLERWSRELRWLKLSDGGLHQQRLAIAKHLTTTFKK